MTKISENWKGIFYFRQKYVTHTVCHRVNLFAEPRVVVKELHTKISLYEMTGNYPVR